MTCPKDGGKLKVIDDLSYPYEYGKSINSVVTNSDIYLEIPYILKLPTIESIN
jgi:hypothetical protein